MGEKGWFQRVLRHFTVAFSWLCWFTICFNSVTRLLPVNRKFMIHNSDMYRLTDISTSPQMTLDKFILTLFSLQLKCTGLCEISSLATRLSICQLDGSWGCWAHTSWCRGPSPGLHSPDSELLFAREVQTKLTPTGQRTAPRRCVNTLPLVQILPMQSEKHQSN